MKTLLFTLKKFWSLWCHYYLEDTEEQLFCDFFFPGEICFSSFSTFITEFQTVRAVSLLRIGCDTQKILYSENSSSYLPVSSQRIYTHFLFCLSSNMFIKLSTLLLGHTIPLLFVCTLLWLDHLYIKNSGYLTHFSITYSKKSPWQ